MSVRLKLTLSYAGFLMLAGALLLAVGYVSLSRGVHPGVIFMVRSHADLLRDFAPIAAIVMAFLLVFGLLGGWLLAGRMLAPLTRITDATRVAANGSLSHRIELEGRNDEFRELADSFDTMLARLEAHVAEQERLADEQQRFAANASHELRTPLAVTQTLLDVARKNPIATTTSLSTASTTSTPERSTSRKPSSCSAAPTNGPSPRNTSTCPSWWKKPPRRSSPSPSNAASPSKPPATSPPSVGSPALLLQMATNLVHNAIVHNLPEHGTVWVTTSVQPESVVLTVENTGEKLTPQLVSTLDEPFQRGSRRIAPTTQVSASAWRSSRASPRRTTEPSPLPPGRPAGSASWCNYPPRPPRAR